MFQRARSNVVASIAKICGSTSDGGRLRNALDEIRSLTTTSPSRSRPSHRYPVTAWRGAASSRFCSLHGLLRAIARSIAAAHHCGDSRWAVARCRTAWSVGVAVPRGRAGDGSSGSQRCEADWPRQRRQRCRKSSAEVHGCRVDSAVRLVRRGGDLTPPARVSIARASRPSRTEAA